MLHCIQSQPITLGPVHEPTNCSVEICLHIFRIILFIGSKVLNSQSILIAKPHIIAIGIITIKFRIFWVSQEFYFLCPPPLTGSMVFIPCASFSGYINKIRQPSVLHFPDIAPVTGIVPFAVCTIRH